MEGSEEEAETQAEEETPEMAPEMETNLHRRFGVSIETLKGILEIAPVSKNWTSSGGLTVVAQTTFLESDPTLQTIDLMHQENRR